MLASTLLRRAARATVARLPAAAAAVTAPTLPAAARCFASAAAAPRKTSSGYDECLPFHHAFPVHDLDAGESREQGE